MKTQNLKLLTTATIKISAKTNFDKFFWRNVLTQIYLNAFNLFAPCKEKYSRGNNMSLTAKNS